MAISCVKAVLQTAWKTVPSLTDVTPEKFRLRFSAKAFFKSNSLGDFKEVKIKLNLPLHNLIYIFFPFCKVAPKSNRSQKMKVSQENNTFIE